jgi:sigma-B regulation protein RsbU (phosphoserine phosphatase)
VLEVATRLGSLATAILLRTYFFGTFSLALVSLVSNRLLATDPEVRRKTGVILWGTIAGIVPFLLLMAVASSTGRAPYQFPYWLWAPCVLTVALLPASFAYAVVKHRVLEIPVLLRRSARYVLVKRGFVLLVVLWAIAGTVIFSIVFTRFVHVSANVAIGVGVGFGLLLAGILSPAMRRVTERIDRAFFRSAYDARRTLENLAAKIRTATSRESLGALLESEIGQALHPASVAVFFAARDGRLHALADCGALPGGAPADGGTHADRGALADGAPAPREALSLDLAWLRELARAGEPLDVASQERGTADAVPAAIGGNPTECVVPILGRDGALAGLAVLGPRLSEEPYSRDDRQLLVSVANQAGIALDSLRMAEEIAERMEAERRVAFELEVARGVQSRLLPQGAPRIETLECAGACIPARIVGGDYYDFIELGGGEVGLVLADIAGKGMAGALLMANLQASLRSQAGLAREDLPRLLRGVNRAMVESSADSRFATLFFGCYAADTRRMRYANCGHDPPILMRADGRVERLSATATVLGAFETWESTMVEICLAPGDTLVLYSDGIPEAMNERRAEFGEAGLLEALRRHRGLGVSELLSAILATVQEHSRGKPEDDVTLVVARCR